MSTTIPMSINDVKNKILADMPEAERLDAIIAQPVRDTGYIILTERRVIEIYELHDVIYAQEKRTEGIWEELEHTS